MVLATSQTLKSVGFVTRTRPSRKFVVRPLNYKSKEQEKIYQQSNVDYYEVLQVSKKASISEIKQKYRQLQKKHHPDNPSTNGNIDMSILLNQAYLVLTDDEQRQKYDSQQTRHRVVKVRELRREEGLVKVVAPDMQLATVAVENSECSVEDIQIWIREWCTTMAFGCDLPLPIPVQADPIPEGARLSFITIQQNSITSLGELIFKIQTSGPISVQIWRRVWNESVRDEIPGEKIVVKNFQKSFKKYVDPKFDLEDRFQLSGLPATIMSGMLHLLPVFGEDGDAGYEAYHLKPLQKVSSNEINN